VVSTIPIPELIKVLDDVPNDVIEAVEGLNFNSLITVGIGIDKPKLNDFSWLYIPDKDILSHRVSFPSNYSRHVAPSGKSSILAEITYREGDQISKMKDEEIAEITIENLHKLEVLNKKDVILVTIHKFKYAYVIYNLNYKNNLEAIFKYLNKIGIDSIGRFGSWKYANMDAVIKMTKSYVEQNFESSKGSNHNL